MTSFAWPYDGAHISLAGSFNNWHPTPMTKTKQGFHLVVDLAPGTYEYKFVVDGRRWCYDILKPNALDDRGNRNNVIVIADSTAPVPKGGKKTREHVVKPETSPAPVAEEEPETVQEEPKGKGKKQQKQQQQPQKGKGKTNKVPQEQSQKLVSTVKSYDVPFYVGDVDCGDSIEDTVATAQLFQRALPNVGVLVISGDVQHFIAVGVVPEEKSSTLPATQLVDTALSVVAGAPPAEGNATFASGVIKGDPDKGLFPLKLKDLCRGPVFPLLRKLGLVKEEVSEDEMFFMDE